MFVTYRGLEISGRDGARLNFSVVARVLCSDFLGVGVARTRQEVTAQAATSRGSGCGYIARSGFSTRAAGIGSPFNVPRNSISISISSLLSDKGSMRMCLAPV